MTTCPYCGNNAFKGSATFTPDAKVPDKAPDAYRWLNQCAGCGQWSVWLPGGTQEPLPDPNDPGSLE